MNMELNPACVFDIQKLAVEQISKSSGYVTILQKPLKKVYFPFKKNFAINPPLPYHKVVAGSQGIAFSSGTPTISSLPPNTSPKIDKYFQKESIISALSLKFDHQGKNKKFKGAFITLDKKEREEKSKEYSELYFTLDDKDSYLTFIEHPAIFICIIKPPNSKHLEAHIFICSSDNQALDIVKALKGELINPQSEPSVMEQGIVNEQPSLISYPPLSPQQFQVSMPFYSPPHQPNPLDTNAAGTYEQMFHNMNLHSPVNMHQPLMPTQSLYVQNQFMNSPYPHHQHPTTTHPNYYPDFQMLGAVYPHQLNPCNYNAGNGTVPLTIPRPNVTGPALPEMPPNYTDQTMPNPNFPTKFQRPVPPTQHYPYQGSPMNPSMLNNVFTNPQTFPDTNFPQTGQLHFGRMTPSPNFPSIQQNIQHNPGLNMPYQGNQQPVMTKPAVPPQISPTERNSNFGSIMSNCNQITGQNLTEERIEPRNVANQMSPPLARPEQIRPNVPSKPGKPFVNTANNDPKPELKQPKKIIGVRVMPSLPTPMQQQQQQPPPSVNSTDDQLASKSSSDQDVSP